MLVSSRRRKLKSGSEYRNKGKLFLLPMLGIKLNHINDSINHLIDVNFIQSSFPQIVLIFDNVDYEPLKGDIYIICNNSYYLDIEYADDNKEICVYFDVPKEFRKDFEMFTKGSYSKMSAEFKDLLIKKYGTYRESGVSPKTGLPFISVYDVIEPLEETRKLFAKQMDVDLSLITEVLSPPNLEEEEFKTIEEMYEKRENIPNTQQMGQDMD